MDRVIRRVVVEHLRRHNRGKLHSANGPGAADLNVGLQRIHAVVGFDTESGEYIGFEGLQDLGACGLDLFGQ